MDLSVPDFIKMFLSIGTPVCALLGYFIKENKSAVASLDDKVDKLETRITVTETNTAVINTKLDAMKETITEIRRGVGELVDNKRNS